MKNKILTRLFYGVALIILLVVSMQNCKREATYEEKLEEQRQLNEMRIAHSDRGLTIIEDGYLTVLLYPEYY